MNEQNEMKGMIWAPRDDTSSENIQHEIQRNAYYK